MNQIHIANMLKHLPPLPFDVFGYVFINELDVKLTYVVFFIAEVVANFVVSANILGVLVLARKIERQIYFPCIPRTFKYVITY